MKNRKVSKNSSAFAIAFKWSIYFENGVGCDSHTLTAPRVEDWKDGELLKELTLFYD